MASEVSFETDGGRIDEGLRRSATAETPLIIGSGWERDIAKELRSAFACLGAPLVERLILDRGYVGYRGGLRLLEDIYGNILSYAP